MAQRKILDLTNVNNAQLTDSGTNNDLEYLKANGPRSLPPSPTENKWSADAIKKLLYTQPEILFAWLKELAVAVKTFAEGVDDLLAEGTVYSAGHDGSGNDIAQTYATKAEASATDATVVHLAGTETITGAKTFATDVAFGSSGSDNSKQFNVYFATNLRGPVASSTITPGNTGFTLGTSSSRWHTSYVQYLDVSESIKKGSYTYNFPSGYGGTFAMISDLAAEIGKIQDGTYVAGKANKDGSGNTITSIYETKADASAKVALANLRTILGLASSSAQGLMSSDDKAHLDALYALLGAQDDSDAVVNTINEVLAIFAQYPEGVTLANALALKVAFSDVINNLESNEISKPLSAYQGKVLDGRLAEVEENYVDHDDVFAAAMFTVTDYDQSSGEITLEYSSSAITDITYNSSTGQIVFTY